LIGKSQGYSIKPSLSAFIAGVFIERFRENLYKIPYNEKLCCG
jgi:hypothetical protein